MNNYFELNPIEYGLNKRLKLLINEDNKVVIERIIKSRIIQKDAHKLLEVSHVLKKSFPDSKIAIRCTKNICSKSIKLLEDNQIEIDFAD